MDLQERAVIAAVQLKSSTYRKDKISALNEALDIVSDDNVIGGTEFIDPLVHMLKERQEAPTEEGIFKVLSKIFTGKNGREFTNIFIDKIGSAFVIDIIHKAEELSEEKKEVLFTLIKHNKIHITEEIVRTNTHTGLIDTGLSGAQTVIEILVELGKSSNIFRKILIFNGFIEGLMRLGQNKRRELARSSILSLAILMNSDISVVKYFFEMRWKEWTEHALKNHPEHTLKIIYALSEYRKYRIFLSVFKETLLTIKDTASLFLLSYTEAIHDKRLIKTAEAAKTTKCPSKLNYTVGIYTNYYRANSLSIDSVSIGSVEYLGLIYSSTDSTLVDDIAISTFLQRFSSIPSMDTVDALVFVKTSIGIALREGNEVIFISEVLLSLREYLQNDSILLDLKVLISFWLLLGYIYHKDRSSFLDSVFSDFYETVLPLAMRFLTSLTDGSYNQICQDSICNRCYYLQLTAPNVIPHSISLLVQLLWVPTPIYPLILSKFSLFLSYPQDIPLFPSVTNNPPDKTEPEEKPPIKTHPPTQSPPNTSVYDL